MSAPPCLALALLLAVLPLGGAAAQGIDLSQGGPIAITASDGITWLRAQKEVIARGNARAVRQNVTVTADTLTAWYRPAPGAPATASTDPADDQGGNQIYKLQAEGNVHIFTATDRARCDRAVYDLDQAVLVMTGNDLRLTTPNDVLTAKRDMEYWSAKHMAVARGDAVVVTKDARRIQADVLVAYTTPSPPAATPAASVPAGPPADPAAASGKLRKVEAFGHVILQTPSDIVTGDRGVYDARTGIARLAGNVHITRGGNELAGQGAVVNMKTGIATLLAAPGGQVKGLIVPKQQPASPPHATPGGPKA
ncbi:MAG: LptA/OstA family protein [Acetobacteraceae bacterium]